MHKGSLVVIDGLNYATGGCMTALKENLDINKLKLKTLDYYLILLTSNCKINDN